MKIISEHFGTTNDGVRIERYVLTDGRCSAGILTLGGIIQSLCVPDQYGTATDVVLGFDSVSDYEAQDCYIGALLGRCANRMSKGNISVGGKELSLAWNDAGRCHLHGGNVGFNAKVWTPEVSEDQLILHNTSCDGEEGYPGEMHISVAYQLKDQALSLHYRAVCDQDTICNLSNHVYFNLSGHSSGEVGRQNIQVFADYYTPLAEDHAPNGDIQPVAGTPLDLRTMQTFSDHWDDTFPQMTLAGGYDHNYLIAGKGMRRFAKAVSEETGICMTTESDMPGMQLYSGNFLCHLPQGKNQTIYGRRCGFCIETQYTPNAVYHPAFTSPKLGAGQPYKHTTVYRFSNR